MVTYNTLKMLRIGIVMSFGFSILFSCAKFNENIHINKYAGTWTLVSYQLDSLNSSGDISYTSQNSAITGVLKLDKNKTYVTENFSIPTEITSANDWELYYRSKKDVLIFNKLRGTVTKKSRSKLELEFFYGDGTGKIAYKETLFFNKK